MLHSSLIICYRMRTFYIWAFGFVMCLNIRADVQLDNKNLTIIEKIFNENYDATSLTKQMQGDKEGGENASKNNKKVQSDINNPTIIEKPFNENDDATTLTNWMQGDKKGEKAEDIINLVTQRTSAQRQKIRAAYASQNNNKDLKDELYEYTKKNKKAGSVEHADSIKDIFRSPTEYLLTRIANTYDARVTKLSKSYNDLSSALMLIPCTGEQLRQINDLDSQWNNDGNTLSQRIINKKDTGNEGTDKSLPIYSSLMLYLLGHYGFRMNDTANENSTDAMLSAIPEDSIVCSGDHTRSLFLLLSTMSFEQIRAAALQYNQNHTEEDIVTHIKYTCNDDDHIVGPILAKIFQFALDSNAYFSEQIFLWIDKTLTNHQPSIGPFIAITRCEIDLEAIKARYHDDYKVQMVDDFNEKLKKNKLNAKLFENLINGNRNSQMKW